MADYKKTLYNVSIANQGFLLTGIPQHPARIMKESSVFEISPTQVDLAFKDSSQFLPWAQTDFSGGFQFEKWSDNAGFKKGTGLEYIAKYGELTLLNDKSSTVKDLGAGYTFGASCIFNQLLLIGTQHATLATLGYLDSDDGWQALTTAWSDIIKVHGMDESGGKVYIALERDSGSEKCLQSWDGASASTNFADATGDATDTTIWRMVKRIETRLYASNFNSAANGDRLLYSDNGGTNWTVIITATGKNRTITQGVDNFGTLYFLIEDFPRTELWWCNDTLTTQIYRWENLTNPRLSVWLGKVFVEGKQDGKLMRFEWNGATLKTIFEEKIRGKAGSATATTANHLIDTTLSQFVAGDVGKIVWNTTDNTYAKITVFSSSSDVTLDANIMANGEKYIISELDLDTSPMIVYKNNLHSYGLVYDGLFHFPSWIFKYTANKIYPFAVFGSTTAQVPYFYGLDSTTLKITKLDTAAYLTTGNVITGIFNGGKPAVNKLWNSITLSFKEMVSGQTIVAEYSTDDEGNWTTIDTISPTTDETEKTLYFPANITSKRIQIRLTLTGGGTNTPTVYDFIVRFLSLADNRFEWALRLNCSDNLMLLDGKTTESKRGSELRNLLMIARFENQIVEFQDVDFAETLLNETLTATDTTITVDSTVAFPEQGRIKIEQEEILYTGKTAVAFTGCTRGARGTKKATHADDTRVHSAYNVIITNIPETNPVAPKAKTLESEVTVSLLEV